MSEPRDSRPTMPTFRSSRPPSLPQMVVELRDLVVTYFKQQTVVPVKKLGRYLAFGMAGSVFMGTGVLLIALGCLRLLQTETGTTFTGDWSWVPYVIVVAGLVIGAAIVWLSRKTWRVQRELQR